MSSRAQSFDIQIKLLCLGALLACGVCASAYAQSSLPALPALPALPSVPQPSSSLPSLTPVNGSTAPTAELTPVSGITIPLPGNSSATPATTASTLPTTATTAGVSSKTPPLLGSKTPPLSPLSQLPAPQPEATEPAATPATATAAATPTPAADGALPALPGMPALPLPGVAATPTQPSTTTAAATLPEINVDTQGENKDKKAQKEEKKVKSWQTKLAATNIAPLPNFRYKRELLPEVIYRPSYNRENLHLPTRMTRDDYANLLLSSVSRNDVEATRALLNAGTALNVTTPSGETALALAQRVGATEVAALLTARGAR